MIYYFRPNTKKNIQLILYVSGRKFNDLEMQETR